MCTSADSFDEELVGIVLHNRLDLIPDGDSVADEVGAFDYVNTLQRDALFAFLDDPFDLRPQSRFGQLAHLIEQDAAQVHLLVAIERDVVRVNVH